MNGERLEQITDWASLREGMLVVVEYCPRCPDRRGMHRGILIGQQLAMSTGETCWRLLPSPHVGFPHGLVGPSSTKPEPPSRTWRVVDGLESSLPTSTQKRTPKREGVR